MQKYGDVIAEIAALLEQNELRKQELQLSSEDLQRNYNSYFVKMFNMDILKELSHDFQTLIDIERTVYLISSSKNPEEYNRELLKLCIEKSKETNEETADYVRLIELLIRCNGKHASELIEHCGYFVLREDFVSFISLCSKLKVGPYIAFKDAKKDHFVKKFEQNREQYNRIIKNLKEYYESKNKVVPLNEEVNPVVAEKPIFQTVNHNEIIYLGITGKLTIDMVASLKKTLSSDEYEELLNDLRSWQIFSESDIIEINRQASTSITYINSMDELVEFFITKDDLDIDSLKVLAPSIGEVNFLYIIDQLFRFGILDPDIYLNYLKSITEPEKK